MSQSPTVAMALQFLAPFAEGPGIILPMVLFVAGATLHLYLPHHRMSVEERVKDCLMSAAEARWQLQFLRLSAPTLTLLGLILAAMAIRESMG